MPQSISVGIRGIATALKENKLEVPVHQRSYTWEEAEVKEFLQDVGDAFDREKEEYFLGSIVVITGDGAKAARVLDGQQRLATTALILAGIADELVERNEQRRGDELRKQYLAEYDIETGVDILQLKLNEIDDPYFRTVINRDIAEPQMGAPESHIRMYDARNAARQWIRKKTGDAKDPVKYLVDFIRYLSEGVYVVLMTAPDDANAYLIFEAMNDRGVDLSIADLLKNYLLGRSPEREHPSIIASWTGSLSSLRAYGTDDLFVTFLRHFWVSKYPGVREKELYRNIKDRVHSATNVMDFAQELVTNSYCYAAILSTEHEFWTGATANGRDRLQTLLQLGLEQYRPMLLAALVHLQLDEVEKILRLLISWNVRLLIVGGLGGGVMEKKYSELGQKIRSGELKTVDDIAKKGESFIPSDAAFEASFSRATISKVQFCRYVLRTLERQATGENQPELVPNADPGELTLEHILPEKPEGNWPQFSEEQRRAYTKRIGNMLLLKEKMNSKLRSSPFTEKAKFYEKSGLVLTKQVSESKQWTTKEIEERQKNLAQLAVEAWKLKAGG